MPIAAMAALALGLGMKHLLLSCILVVSLVLSGAAHAAQGDELSSLFAQLKQADDSNWQALEREIEAQWARSGSDAMDLLLHRGRQALERDDVEAALDHLSALTDHAPNFAEGWHARATAHFVAGRLGVALEDLARALSLEPRHFGALEGLGVILEELDDPKRALFAYGQVLAIHPQNPDVKEAVARLNAALSTDL